MRIEQRLKENDKAVISPVSTQLGGFFLSVCIFFLGIILFENTIAEWSNWFWGWVWRIPSYYWLFRLCLKFFKAGLGPVMPIGNTGVPRLFGKPIERFVYNTGRHWEIPGKGNKMAMVDMRSESIELLLNVTTGGTVDGKPGPKMKMVCKLNLNFYVYDPHIYVEVKEFKKTFESMLSQAFLGFSSTKNADEMLEMDKTTIVDAIKKHIEDIDGDEFKIEDFGIEIQESTISVADGFEFADTRTREAYEAVGREEKEKESQKTETDNLIQLALNLVAASNDKLSFSEAYLRIHQQYGKNPPEEKIFRIAGIDEETIKFLTNILNRRS